VFRLRVSTCAVMFLLVPAVLHADVVTDWNNHWLDCVRAIGGPPCPIARAGAMVHAAIFDAVNAIERDHEPYLVRIHAPRRCPKEAAAAVAAHDVLVHLYPGRREVLDDALAASLADVPNGPFKIVATRLGRLVARRMIFTRSRDGSGDNTPYVPGTGPGDWRPTYPDFTPPFNPNWGGVEPWCMHRGDQFRPIGPLGITNMQDLLADQGYLDMFNEVKDLGARNSASRTPYQTETAFFWANDVDGTYKPPGHLNHIAQVLAEQEGLTTSERARLFALLNIALADAGICAWDCKYDTAIDFWRPITGIREADTDGNPLTLADPSWEPLNAFTPPFPAYTSGHATFAATAAAIFAGFFATDHITHTISTDDPLYTGGPRTYTSFSEAAIENGRSRIYLGVHWQFDADDGLVAGTALGNYVYANFLRPVRFLEVAAEVAVEEEGVPLALSRNVGLVRVVSDRKGPQSIIEYELPAAGRVQVAIFDVLGRHLATLVDGHRGAGLQTAFWTGRLEGGSPAPSGVYFVRVDAGGVPKTEKLIHVR
jgi:hypothetical protein